jgi:hypothetical protein
VGSMIFVRVQSVSVKSSSVQLVSVQFVSVQSVGVCFLAYQPVINQVSLPQWNPIGLRWWTPPLPPQGCRPAASYSTNMHRPL